MKKTILTVIALLAIGFAVFGVIKWQKNVAGEPVRQEKEIR
ncbi:MAG: hypothetical protein WC536_00585 [Patescibacteria group bacterium]